jgi:hypothetical protein
MVKTLSGLHFCLQSRSTRQRNEDKFRGIIYALDTTLFFCECCNKGARFASILRHLRSKKHRETSQAMLCLCYGGDAIVNETVEVSFQCMR